MIGTSCVLELHYLKNQPVDLTVTAALGLAQPPSLVDRLINGPRPISVEKAIGALLCPLPLSWFTWLSPRTLVALLPAFDCLVCAAEVSSAPAIAKSTVTSDTRRESPSRLYSSSICSLSTSASNSNTPAFLTVRLVYPLFDAVWSPSAAIFPIGM